MKSEYLSHARNELTEYFVYGKLAAREKNPVNRAVLKKLSTQEKKHAEFWQSLITEENAAGASAVAAPAAPAVPAVKPYAFTIRWISLFRTIFGVTFTVKLLETHEQEAVVRYQKMLAAVPPSHKAQLEEIIKDEQSHERALFEQLKEKRVSYIGFIALGLADAIVEITGVHAGFLGVTGQTLIAGISGIIVGFAAAISMGSAAYLQAKQDPEKSPLLSGVATGSSYLFAVIFLATPYFLLSAMIPAFIVSTSVGIVLLAGFTFYGAVLFDRRFITEFAESVSLMLGTALATYLLGEFVGKIFNISGRSF